MFTPLDQDELFEAICLVIEAYIRLNMNQYIQPTFHAGVVRDIVNTFKLTLKTVEADIEIDMQAYLASAVERGLALFYKHIAPPRANGPTFIRIKPNRDVLRAKIDYLQKVPQPEQRTPEWYEFRYKHLTASNIWKVFISDSTRNQLIFEKCQPLQNNTKFNSVSLDSPMHWGQKYEPVSIQLYEHIYKAPVTDFGCIPHQTLEFLAASPDGIVTAAESLRYGRMLEVKNIVNSEINGNPKMEYWIQMQLQMEVCALNECDFLETRFTEYADEEAFATDIVTEHKGRMMLFMSSGGKPIYEYAPLYPYTPKDTNEAWAEAMMEKNANLTWIKNIYWKLEEISCVLVLRNKLWFASVVDQLKEFWATIEREKVTGYKHREPKKAGLKVKKIYTANEDITMQAQCFITL